MVWSRNSYDLAIEVLQDGFVCEGAIEEWSARMQASGLRYCPLAYEEILASCDEEEEEEEGESEAEAEERRRREEEEAERAEAERLARELAEAELRLIAEELAYEEGSLIVPPLVPLGDLSYVVYRTDRHYPGERELVAVFDTAAQAAAGVLSHMADWPTRQVGWRSVSAAELAALLAAPFAE